MPLALEHLEHGQAGLGVDRLRPAPHVVHEFPAQELHLLVVELAEGCPQRLALLATPAGHAMSNRSTRDFRSRGPWRYLPIECRQVPQFGSSMSVLTGCPSDR